MIMKKITSILAVAAMMLVACNKDNGQTPVELPQAPNEDFQLSLRVNQAIPAVIPALGGEPLQLDFPASKTGFAEVSDGLKDKIVTFDFEVLTSKVEVGTTYVVKGIGKFVVAEVNGNLITMNYIPEGSSTVYSVIKGTILSGKNPSLPSNAFRGWTIAETWISVTGDDIDSSLGVAKKFNGFSALEICNYVSEKGVKIDMSKVDDGWDVKKVILTDSGKIIIYFKGKDPYYGDFTVSEGKFNYKFKYYDEDDPILSGEASGTFGVLPSGKGRLEVLGSVKTDKGGKKYQARGIFFLAPEKAE